MGQQSTAGIERLNWIQIIVGFDRTLIELIEGERPMLVHSQMPNADSKIKAFRNTDKRWIVSVAMISEGVDIQRLRVLIYLPNGLTELAFRQAIGRVVRTVGPTDDTRAYVVMPSFETFEQYARRVEADQAVPLQGSKRTGDAGPVIGWLNAGPAHDPLFVNFTNVFT